jgi:hypothetical protein
MTAVCFWGLPETHCYRQAADTMKPQVSGTLLKHFIIQQMHKYIIRRYNQNYYKIFKIFKIAPTCFGSQGIHYQGAL